MELDYIFSINELKQKKWDLEKDVASLTFEKDKVYNEISNQRASLDRVKQEISELNGQKFKVYDELDAIKKHYNEVNVKYADDKRRMTNAIEYLDKQIDEKTKISESYKISEKDLKNISAKIEEKTAKLESLNAEAIRVSDLLKNSLKSAEIVETNLKERELAIREKEEYIEKTLLAIEAREQKVTRKERRVAEYQQDVLNKSKDVKK